APVRAPIGRVAETPGGPLAPARRRRSALTPPCPSSLTSTFDPRPLVPPLLVPRPPPSPPLDPSLAPLPSPLLSSAPGYAPPPLPEPTPCRTSRSSSTPTRSLPA